MRGERGGEGRQIAVERGHPKQNRPTELLNSEELPSKLNHVDDGDQKTSDDSNKSNKKNVHSL